MLIFVVFVESPQQTTTNHWFARLRSPARNCLALCWCRSIIFCRYDNRTFYLQRFWPIRLFLLDFRWKVACKWCVSLKSTRYIEAAKCFWYFANIWAKNMLDVNIYDREKKLQERMRNENLRSLTYLETS